MVQHFNFYDYFRINSFSHFVEPFINLSVKGHCRMRKQFNFSLFIPKTYRYEKGNTAHCFCYWL
jgi:hypothetical protein